MSKEPKVFLIRVFEDRYKKGFKTKLDRSDFFKRLKAKGFSKKQFIAYVQKKSMEE